MDKGIVLVISPTATHPLNQGNRLRIFEVCKYIQDKGYKIHFFWIPFEYAHAREIYAIEDAMRSQWSRVFCIYNHNESWHSPPQHSSKHLIDEWVDPRSIDFAASLSRANKYSAVIVNYTFFSILLQKFPSETLKILDTHDKFTDRDALFASINSVPDFFYCDKDQEAKALDRADIVLSIKSQEKDFFETISTKTVINIPYAGIYLSSNTPSVKSRDQLSSEEALRVGFIGANNQWNKQSICRFIEDTYTSIYRSQAPIQFVIAGSVCDSLSGLQSFPHVSLIGKVSDVRKFYSECDLIINPMMTSTGFKIKTIEAMAHNTLILSTSHASEGLCQLNSYLSYDSYCDMGSDLISFAFNKQMLELARTEQKALYLKHAAYAINGFESLLKHISDSNRKKTLLFSDFSEPLSNLYSNILIEQISSSRHVYLVAEKLGPENWYRLSNPNRATLASVSRKRNEIVPDRVLFSSESLTDGDELSIVIARDLFKHESEELDRLLQSSSGFRIVSVSVIADCISNNSLDSLIDSLMKAGIACYFISSFTSLPYVASRERSYITPTRSFALCPSWLNNNNFAVDRSLVGYYSSEKDLARLPKAQFLQPAHVLIERSTLIERLLDWKTMSLPGVLHVAFKDAIRGDLVLGFLAMLGVNLIVKAEDCSALTDDLTFALPQLSSQSIWKGWSAFLEISTSSDRRAWPV